MAKSLADWLTKTAVKAAAKGLESIAKDVKKVVSEVEQKLEIVQAVAEQDQEAPKEEKH